MAYLGTSLQRQRDGDSAADSSELEDNLYVNRRPGLPEILNVSESLPCYRNSKTCSFHPFRCLMALTVLLYQRPQHMDGTNFRRFNNYRAAFNGPTCSRGIT